MKAKPINPSLPQELIRDILVRLPVKSLLQFKCVSKSWLTLISSPDFVKDHLHFSAKDYTHHRLLLQIEKYCLKHCSVSSLFNAESVTEIFDLDYPIKTAHKYVHVVGSVNGLICLRIGYERMVIVWNPSTRKLKQVPGLVPTGLCGYGFGYDDVNDDYKIVNTLCVNLRSIDAKIYSLKMDSWKTLDDFQCGDFFDDSPKFVNRRLHWLTSTPGVLGIMSFDLVDEKCRKIELPCYEVINCELQLGELESYFSVFCNFKGDYEIDHTDLCVMKEYGIKESWMKLYTIKYPCYSDYFVSSPLCIYEGEIACVSTRDIDHVSTTTTTTTKR